MEKKISLKSIKLYFMPKKFMLNFRAFGKRSQALFTVRMVNSAMVNFNRIKLLSFKSERRRS